MADSPPKTSARLPKPESPAPSGINNEVRPFSWYDPGTWPASLKFLPAYIALVAIFIAVYYNKFTDTSLDLTTYEACASSFNYGFRVNAALSQAHDHSKRSWEMGYAYEGTQQIFNPDRSVFGRDPFPNGKVPPLGLKLDEASLYIQSKINKTGKALFYEEDGAVSDPAALGVAALQFGQRRISNGYLEAAARQKDFLLKEAPRHTSKAISHRPERVELWSDAIAMFPPFLAYYGVANDDIEIVEEAFSQIGRYWNLLQIQDDKAKQGLWKHIVPADTNIDAGAWSTGNAWAAYGMARVRATIAAWPTSSVSMTTELAALDHAIQQILDGAIRTDDDPSGLLRNYLGDKSTEGETSGTSLLAATAYRMAILSPEQFAKDEYLNWTNQKRKAVFERIDENGIARPAVNPYEPKSKKPIEISPEGESFLLLLGAAWRDCVCRGPSVCLQTYLEENPTEAVREISLQGLTGYSLEEVPRLITEPIQRLINYFKPPGT